MRVLEGSSGDEEFTEGAGRGTEEILPSDLSTKSTFLAVSPNRLLSGLQRTPVIFSAATAYCSADYCLHCQEDGLILLRTAVLLTYTLYTRKKKCDKSFSEKLLNLAVWANITANRN